MTLYLTRATLRADASVGAILPVLLNAKGDAGHNLAWSIATEDADQTRDYLWRSNGPDLVYLLSERKPSGGPLYDTASVPVETYAAGDRVRFTLRANPVVRRRLGGRDDKCRKIDPIMHRLHPLPQAERRAQRMQVAQEEVEAWLSRLGDTGGYTLERAVVTSYRQENIRRRGGTPVRFSVVDIEGALTVTDGAAFEAVLKAGFGASRAWGCGLMLTKKIGG